MKFDLTWREARRVFVTVVVFASMALSSAIVRADTAGIDRVDVDLQTLRAALEDGDCAALERLDRRPLTRRDVANTRYYAFWLALRVSFRDEALAGGAFADAGELVADVERFMAEALRHCPQGMGFLVLAGRAADVAFRDRAQDAEYQRHISEVRRRLVEG